MTNLIVFLLLIYAMSIYLAPFPHWSTYLILWKNVLLNQEKAIHLRSRLTQAILLLRYAVLTPLWTGLWYLDELLFPNYRELKIRPVFIIGQPRSGSTLLHRTLASDTANFIAIRHIEWRFPFITVQKLINFFNLSNWIKTLNYWPNTPEGQQAQKMHSNTLSDWEEDGIFFEERFLYHYFTHLRFPYPNLVDYLDDFSNLPEKVQHHILETHKKVIQKVMYLRGSDKLYLSKETTSQTKQNLIAQLYSEGKFIVSTRETIACLRSLFSLIKMSTFCKTGVETNQIFGWEEANLLKQKQDFQRIMDFCKNDFPQERLLTLSFNQLHQNMLLTIQYIYQWLNLEISSFYLNFLEQLEEKQKMRKRGYDYDIQSISFDELAFYNPFVTQVAHQHRVRLELLKNQTIYDNVQNNNVKNN
ncbi:MAG: sulfotransferase [Xenococcus sp. MO_188.B8]|nr:sulfotransferase [Xenococcus sp. MO_188.B8]